MPTKLNEILRDLQRAAVLAGRAGIAIPSKDLYAGLESAEIGRNRQAISELIKSGRAISARRDLLVLPDATGLIKTGILEVVDVIAPRPYLITAGRALQHHDLTDQHFFTVIVLVPMRISDFSHHGENVKFITTEQEHIWETDRAEQLCFATAERAVLDAIASSRYGVSFDQAVKALVLGVRRDEQFLTRLVAKTERYGVDAVARRVGFLVEHAFDARTAAPFERMVGKTRTPVLLRAGGAKTGEVNTKWRIRVNMSTDMEALLG